MRPSVKPVSCPRASVLSHAPYHRNLQFISWDLHIKLIERDVRRRRLPLAVFNRAFRAGMHHRLIAIAPALPLPLLINFHRSFEWLFIAGKLPRKGLSAVAKIGIEIGVVYKSRGGIIRGSLARCDRAFAGSNTRADHVIRVKDLADERLLLFLRLSADLSRYSRASIRRHVCMCARDSFL